MRLTIFHTNTVNKLWKNSFNKLLSENNYSLSHNNEDKYHLAVFNDGVVGITITNNNHIIFLAVRSITQRRGIGKYLMEQTIKEISNNTHYKNIIIDITHYPSINRRKCEDFLTYMKFKKIDNNTFEYTI
ncbi:MAG: GNAT family N-acetyltransferase [Succinivibrionaceae bacterium]